MGYIGYAVKGKMAQKLAQTTPEKLYVLSQRPEQGVPVTAGSTVEVWVDCTDDILYGAVDPDVGGGFDRVPLGALYLAINQKKNIEFIRILDGRSTLDGDIAAVRIHEAFREYMARPSAQEALRIIASLREWGLG